MKNAGSREVSLPAPAPRRRPHGRLLLVIAILALVYLWLGPGGQPEPALATVSVETGQIAVHRADAGDDEAVYLGGSASLQRGDGVSTGETGEAILGVGEGRAFLGSNTDLTVLQLQNKPLLRGLEVSLALENGEIDADMASLGLGGSFVLETDIVTVTGSDLRCVAIRGESVTVEAHGATVWVSQGQERVSLSDGQYVRAVLGQPLQVQGEALIDPTRTPRPRSTAPSLRSSSSICARSPAGRSAPRAGTVAASRCAI